MTELLSRISDRRIRRQVQKLLRFGEDAVRSLGGLDSALYRREGGEEQLQSIRMRVRRIVAVKNRQVRGVLSGMDFAALVAGRS